MSTNEDLILRVVAAVEKKWQGAKPECDLCGQPPQEFFVDGQVKGHSSWALMCQDCFPRYGRGLGEGVGQKYDAKTLKKIGSEAPVETWRDIEARYIQKYGHNHHHLRLVCVKCGNQQTCRCRNPKVEEHGICPVCTGELEDY